MLDLLSSTSVVFYAIGILSMFSHAVKKWTYGEIRGNVWDWYWVHPRVTVGAFLTCVGGIITLILSGTLNDYTEGAQVIAAWGVGYGSDTLNNQGKK